MAGFIRNRGKVKFMYLPVTPSTTLAANSLVTWSSGKLVAAGAATAADNIVGVLEGAIAATDDNYADERLVAVEVPVEKNVEYQFDTTGLVAADLGNDVDLTDAVTVNRAATAIGVVRVIKRLSATEGIGLIRINDAF
jgi:hypothetical protein